MSLAKVDIKGINKGLVFIFSGGSGEEYAAILKSKFDNKRQLFEGSTVSFYGEGLQSLSFDEVAALQRLCLDYGMVLNNIHTSTREASPSREDLFIYRTLRSGQKLHSEGSMIIWGNVHESSEITAAKNIVVLGRLDGTAHAGCYGDIESTIFALNLAPKQIRIGDKISRAPGNYVKHLVPEVAYIEGGNICIKDYTPN